MEEIISIVRTYMEDNPHVVITDDMIRGVIEEHFDSLVEEVKNTLIDGFVDDVKNEL